MPAAEVAERYAQAAFAYAAAHQAEALDDTFVLDLFSPARAE